MVNGAMNADYECNGNFRLILNYLFFFCSLRGDITHTHTHWASETSPFYFANSKGHSSFPISEHEVLAQRLWRITVFHLHSPSGAFQTLFYTGLQSVSHSVLKHTQHSRLLMPQVTLNTQANHNDSSSFA